MAQAINNKGKNEEDGRITLTNVKDLQSQTKIEALRLV
jgi:hypothetical protein